MPAISKYTKELLKRFTSCSNIILISHINPDGDSVGSQLALYHYLISKGKKPEMITPNNLEEFLKWMDCSDRIHIFIKERQLCKKLISGADLIVMLDFNQSHRLGELEDLVIRSGAFKVLIDHHLNPSEIADMVISDPARCSTSELLHRLITGMEGGYFRNKRYAEALYVGIITDTGNFNHGSYDSDTFRIAAQLLETGIEKENILNSVYNNYSSDRMRLMGLALNERMVILPEYKTAYMYLTRNDLSNYKYEKGDTEGFVNLPLSIRDIIFSALFIEKDGFIKLSFRSKGNFAANEFAAEYFSGGGHFNASGGEYAGTLDSTIKYFIDVLKENFIRYNKTS